MLLSIVCYSACVLILRRMTMKELDASKNEPLIMSIWDRWVELCSKVRHAFIVWLILVSIIGFVTYTVLRIHVTYELQRDFALLKATNEQLLEQINLQDGQLRLRIDYLEQTVYGEIQPKQEELANLKAPAMRTSKIEIDQQNANKEIRQRLDRLERWRLSVDK